MNLTDKQLKSRIKLYTHLLRRASFGTYDNSVSFASLYDRRQGYKDTLDTQLTSLHYRMQR